MKYTMICTVFVILAACTGCADDRYSGYEEVFNKDGVVVLRNKTTAQTSDSVWKHNKMTDPSFGRQIDTPEVAINMVRKYQERIPVGDDTTTKYVDLYFTNLQRYMANIASRVTDYEGLGIRIYFAKSIDKNGVAVRNTTVLGPVKKTGDEVVALWRTQPTDFFAFDYGSLCPERCPTGDDLGTAPTTNTKDTIRR